MSRGSSVGFIVQFPLGSAHLLAEFSCSSCVMSVVAVLVMLLSKPSINEWHIVIMFFDLEKLGTSEIGGFLTAHGL